jgi:poly(hydroxyalkanoate) depolymerase family esterase
MCPQDQSLRNLSAFQGIQGTLSGDPRPIEPRAADLDVIIDLTPNVRPANPAKSASPLDRRHGAFLRRSYRGSAGTLDYRLYIPAGVQPMMPLVVMLHGCTQSPEDFARGTDMNRLADELGFLVAYPSQTRAANAQKCWNWFRPGDQRRGKGEPALIAAATQQVIDEQGCDPAQVYITGLSAGGAAAAIMGEAYPDLYAAIGIHSGLACGAARDMPSAFSAMRSGAGPVGATNHFVPVITFHGDSDHTVSEINSRHIIAAASRSADRLNIVSEKGTSPGGRRYTREISSDAQGRAVIEQWTIHGAGHAWSGGARAGSYTDPAGPDASREMVRFFLTHTKSKT